MVLYSDGLVERRASPIDERLDALIRAVPDGPVSAEALCDAVIYARGASAGADNVTVLALGRADRRVPT